ncbi:MAG TPA: hypothetical protein VJ890_06005 [Vineibacter sp.]|nr:hypothetical protein [Vineibacter sp.]
MTLTARRASPDTGSPSPATASPPPARRRGSGRDVQVAGRNFEGPTPERQQHNRITREADQVMDSDGGIGLPWRAESMLERMERNGDISHRERHAGEEFGRLFQLAHLDPLRSADARREGAGTKPDEPHGSERARRRVIAALDALGGQSSPCGTCAWFVLGCELSIRAWALREGWGGKPLSPHTAKGTLLGALGVLARHFGM